MPEQDQEQQTSNRFKNIDVKFCHCFGGYQTSKNWLSLAEQSITDGWRNIDSNMIEQDLANDVNRSYQNIAMIEIVDLATEVAWVAKYINDKSLWKLEIKDSSTAEVLDEDKAAFFQSEEFGKILRDCGDTLIKALKIFNDVVKTHLEKAEMLEVDEVKLSAILYWLNDKMFMDNFRIGKYIY